MFVFKEATPGWGPRRRRRLPGAPSPPTPQHSVQFLPHFLAFPLGGIRPFRLTLSTGWLLGAQDGEGAHSTQALKADSLYISTGTLGGGGGLGPSSIRSFTFSCLLLSLRLAHPSVRRRGVGRAFSLPGCFLEGQALSPTLPQPQGLRGLQRCWVGPVGGSGRRPAPKRQHGRSRIPAAG